MKYMIVLQAITPIAHQDTSNAGNTTNVRLFMRQAMLVNGIATQVPSISENALRTVLFRETLADGLMQDLGVQRGELPQAVVNLLFSGGNMAAGSKAPSNEIELGHMVKRNYPNLDLLGGAVDGFILPKSRLKVSAWLVTREYLPALKYIAPDLCAEAENISVYDLVSEETRTRGTGGEASGNQMLYTYETLAAGAKLVVELVLDPHTPELALSALGYALERWQGFIGGQGRQGRGRMAIVSHDLPSSNLYRQYIADNAGSLKDGLVDGTLGTGKKLCA